MTMRTFRGDSLEALLPQIREELGPDAVVIRHRAGVVGGLGGFFGKRCIEVDAHTAAVEPPAPVPARAVVDLYDHGEPPEPDLDEPENDSVLLRTLVAQASPFANRLEQALARDTSRVPIAPPADERRAVEEALVRAGLAGPLAAGVVEEAAAQWAPFGVGIREALAHVLGRCIPTGHGWKTRRRRIALVGAARSGKTSAVAALARAYAGSGLSVGVISLERPRRALRLGELTDVPGIELEIAAGLAEARLAARRLRSHDLVVADTPAFDPADRSSGRRLAGLLDAVGAQDVHVVLANRSAVVEELRSRTRVDRLILTGTPVAGVVVALASGIPVSYVSRAAGEIAPADPAELGRAVASEVA